MNGLVLVYKWPDGILLITSGAGLALAVYIIYRAGHIEPRSVRLVPSRGAAPATAPSTGTESGSQA